VRILLVDDHSTLRTALAASLRAAGHAVDEAGTRQEAELQVGLHEFGLIVLDRGLPDGDGLDSLRRWRATGVGSPILVLTARDAVADRVEGLDAGADDYVVKPVEPAELLARARSLARRGPTTRALVLRRGDVEFDLARSEVRRAGVLLPMRPKELAVLQVLMERSGRVVTRTQLREECWDDSRDSDSNVEEAAVSALRRKLGAPPLIRTRRGLGWVFDG